MKKQIFVTDENLHEAIKSFTSKMMTGQKGWRKDKELSLIEFQIEGIIKKHLEGYVGIKFE